MDRTRNERMRKRLNLNRFLALFASLCVAASVVLYFVGGINPWYCLIIESYFIGIIFLLNISVQEIKHGAPLPILNAVLGVLFFGCTVFLIAYGFTAGFLTLNF